MVDVLLKTLAQETISSLHTMLYCSQRTNQNWKVEEGLGFRIVLQRVKTAAIGNVHKSAESKQVTLLCL